MMRVLDSFPHPLGGTGIGTTAWHEIDALARSGAEVTAVSDRCDRNEFVILGGGGRRGHHHGGGVGA